MSQNMRATPLSSGRQGSTAKVDASGMAIMSDSSIGLKPVIEEPSNPMPPSKASSSSAALIEKLFSWPSRSVNQRRTKRTSLSSQKERMSFALLGVSATRTTYDTSRWHVRAYLVAEPETSLYTYDT